MHEIERRDWVRQYLGGLEAQIAAFRSLETRVAALEAKWREAEARRRAGQPWEAEGISRSAWYRKRKSIAVGNLLQCCAIPSPSDARPLG